MRLRSFALRLGAPVVIIAAACSQDPRRGTAPESGGSSGNGGETSAGGVWSDRGGTSQAASGARAANAGESAASGIAGLGTSGDAGNVGAAGEAGEAGAPAACVDALALPLLLAAPATLAGTGLYAAGTAAPNEIAPYARAYRPNYEFWSDGTTKQRFVYLPACTQIDTSDMDYWKFPVGTRLWKEFRDNGTLLETRFIHRYGPGEGDWLYATYQWDVLNLSAERALLTDDAGARNVNGTEHDIPSRTDCLYCHLNLPEPPIGFSAIQLSHALPGENLRTLSASGWLTQPATRDYLPPGDETARAALGYLHGNCGHCHNSLFRSHGGAWPGNPTPRMRLSVHDLAVEQTTAYTTLVSVGTANLAFDEYNRIEPCNPGISSVLLRMATRDEEQMPPIASKFADQAGLALVSAFIRHLHAPDAPPCPQ